MHSSWFSAVLIRELRALRRELESYANEPDVWRTVPGVHNSAGTLALHVAGNLRHLIGTELGGTGYRRNRDAEFSRRDVARHELLAEIDAAIAEVETTLRRLGDADLAREYPQPVAGVSVKTGDFLLHLLAHLAYHLGQADYHRRFVTGAAGDIRAVAIPELATAARA